MERDDGEKDDPCDDWSGNPIPSPPSKGNKAQQDEEILCKWSSASS